MKKSFVFTLLALFVFGLASASQISFVDTYDNALKIAGEQDKKLLITFKSPT